jgi:hypothetical protein
MIMIQIVRNPRNFDGGRKIKYVNLETGSASGHRTQFWRRVNDVPIRGVRGNKKSVT